MSEKQALSSADIDLLDTSEILKLINEEDKKIAVAIEHELPQITKAVDMVCASLSTGGRMAYFGAVTSGRIGILDAADCPPTFGISQEQIQAYIAGGEDSLLLALDGVEDDAGLAAQDIAAFNPSEKDIVVSISASGNPRYVVSVLEEAKKRGAQTIGISSNPEARLKPFADLFINPQTGEEVIIGSSRMKAATAQKMILNMLSTAAMVRLGKTYQNMMVDVEISNQKLYNRACGIISQITGVPAAEAADFLEVAGQKVKTACVMAAKKCSPQEAVELLNAAGGILRKVI